MIINHTETVISSAGQATASEVVVSLSPGAHGLRFRKASSPPYIAEILDDCPIADQIKVGDTISALMLPDNTMMTDLTSFLRVC